MNKIFDYGFEDSFFTQDIKALMDINMKRIHMIRIDDNDYLDKNKADVFKDYMKNMPEDELYITTAYISCEEFSPNKYCIFKNEKDVNKKLILVNEVLERENKILEDADFFAEFRQQSFLFQPVERRDQITVAGTAGLNFLYGILQFHDLPFFRNHSFFTNFANLAD